MNDLQNKLAALADAPEVVEAINAATVDTLVAELKAHGYEVTKEELIEAAKQKDGGMLTGHFVIYRHGFIV